jgi:glycosyltransferase involved in cell wall biosynthesis
MRLSVIISTYNAPQWLEKVIWGYASQSHQDFELLIADDGSTEETAVCIERLQREVGFTIEHIWHEDHGFRKCAILNKAIVAAANEYLVFSDGDCVPRWDFLAAHAALAERGCLLSGGVLRLPMTLSERISRQDILSHRVTDPAWLLANGLGENKRLRWLTHGPRTASLLDAVTTTKATWNGGNASAWKTDLLDVNGYDERLQYGGLDRELGERLINAGIRGKQVRHRAIAVHLDHARPYMRQETWLHNDAIRRETCQSRATWTPYGIKSPLRLPALEDLPPTGAALPPRRAAA